ncbi:MAG TPA: HPr family phosphocarrier protein [Planctomycetes bacterium]|nr:HPr family phosphocarrier protein [Fuerstiella sp.]HIK94971.1 HPr family phosphocarrier protein [Planctomycetota bacterium]
MSEDEPHRRQITLACPNGLHLSPITTLVKEVSPLNADVKISFDGKSASAKSAMELMLLGAPQGAKLALEATGSDASAALDAVSRILEMHGE